MENVKTKFGGPPTPPTPFSMWEIFLGGWKQKVVRIFWNGEKFDRKMWFFFTPPPLVGKKKFGGKRKVVSIVWNAENFEIKMWFFYTPKRGGWKLRVLACADMESEEPPWRAPIFLWFSVSYLISISTILWK